LQNYALKKYKFLAMKLPHECHNIEEVRQQIDEIDQSLIGLIGKRFSFIQEIVKYKSNSDEVYAKERYDIVISKRRELATSYQLNPDVIENIYKVMMEYFIREQLELLKKKQK
jgi:isochorismate pyruvate lyase